MDDYAGRVLADRYRLPLPPSDEYELAESRAFDTYSGQEVLVRQVPLPEIVDAEVVDDEELHDLPAGFVPRAGAPGGTGVRRASARTTRSPADPAVRRAMEAAQSAAQIPDHPRLDQVFDVFAEGGSLWIVSELVAARPLAALLADRPLSPYRAAEVAADVLAALRVLHGHGWVHRNITARTVLICDDGRVMLTGLAAGAAEEALCGYDPRPEEEGEATGSAGSVGNVASYGDAHGEPGREPGQEPVRRGDDRWDDRWGGDESGRSGNRGLPLYRDQIGYQGQDRGQDRGQERGQDPGRGRDQEYGDQGSRSRSRAIEPAPESAGLPPGDARAARAGAIAAYRAGTRAAGRVGDDEPAVPGRISDPYGVAGDTKPWHGAVPRNRGSAQDSSRDRDREREQEHAREQEHQPEQEHQREYQPDPLIPAPAPAPRRGPTTALDAERARHARMVVVGAVTERWAPEQAGPVHENWQLAAPIGPSTDLWALGALLFRAVQGHAPYPEDSTAELVQMVCAEPPAFAEECGPLRPVVESLLRQDPTERLDFEELGGWLRSLVRSAPEPEAGAHVVPVPPYDAGRLPVVRRRGEIVRKRRSAAPATTGQGHGRHKHKRGRGKEGRAARAPKTAREARPPKEARLSETTRLRDPGPRASRPGAPRPGGGARPRSLGRLLLIAILMGLVAAVAYAMVFMPKSGDRGSDGRTGSAGEVSSAPGTQDGDKPGGRPSGEEKPGGKPKEKPTRTKNPGSQEPQTTDPDLPRGFALRKDAEGFRVAVATGWDRQPKNGRGQVRYTHGDFELLLVPGRDGTDSYGSDPMKYQREHERELQPFRDSSWATSSGMRRIDVGGRAMAEGQFTWQDAEGREVFVRNLAMVVGGKYHVVQVRGPEAERDEVTRLYEQASTTYQVVG
ncbi:protein kinase [Streptomyces sp. NPDC087300]|uniref:protein kinase n=1 Tax=Streptomyces sp. NPDC087300 TaxID=3365780 RepID=UPI0038276EE1